VVSSGKDSLNFDYLASIFSVDFMRSHNSGSCSKTPIKSRISSKCSLNLLAFSPLGATSIEKSLSEKILKGFFVGGLTAGLN